MNFKQKLNYLVNYQYKKAFNERNARRFRKTKIFKLNEELQELREQQFRVTMANAGNDRISDTIREMLEDIARASRRITKIQHPEPEYDYSKRGVDYVKVDNFSSYLFNIHKDILHEAQFALHQDTQSREKANDIEEKIDNINDHIRRLEKQDELEEKD